MVMSKTQTLLLMVYIQDTNPFADGYVQDKGVFGFKNEGHHLLGDKNTLTAVTNCYR